MSHKPSPQKIANIILSRFSFTSPPQKLITLIEDIFLSDSIDEITAYETAADIQYSVRDELSQILQKNRRDNIISNCELVGDDYTIIVGSSFKRPKDSETKALFREAIPYMNDILETLCRLEPDMFEIFCSRLLKFMGATEAVTTKYTADQGIDFLAKLKFPNTFNDIGLESLENSFYLNIFGQAKRYNKDYKVGTGEIRELIGSLSILQYQEILSLDGGLSEIKQVFGNIRLCDPAICLFMTTGEFSPYAIQLSQKTGVIIKDGRQLATYLAIKKVGLEEMNGKLVFTPEKFISWIGE